MRLRVFITEVISLLSGLRSCLRENFIPCFLYYIIILLILQLIFSLFTGSVIGRIPLLEPFGKAAEKKGKYRVDDT